jgi:hypothetical protein
MKNLIILFAICFSLFSCEKDKVQPETDFVLVSFNDVSNSGLDSVYVFKNDVFVKRVPVGCGKTFKAKLFEKYSFKKKYKNSLVPLYGFQATTDTYLKFLTTSTNPQYCIDYTQEGLMPNIIVNDSGLQCSGVHYTLRASL